MGEEMCVFFYSIVLAGGPKCVARIIISPLSMETAFVLKFHKEQPGFVEHISSWIRISESD